MPARSSNHYPQHTNKRLCGATKTPSRLGHARSFSLTRHGPTLVRPAATSNRQPRANNFPYTTRPHYAAPSSNLKPATMRQKFPLHDTAALRCAHQQPQTRNHTPQFPLHDTAALRCAHQQPQTGNHAPKISITRHGRASFVLLPQITPSQSVGGASSPAATRASTKRSERSRYNTSVSSRIARRGTLPATLGGG